MLKVYPPADSERCAREHFRPILRRFRLSRPFRKPTKHLPFPPSRFLRRS